MKTKAEIVTNWLPRYTGTPLDAKLSLKIGVKSLRELRSSGISVKHLVF